MSIEVISILFIINIIGFIIMGYDKNQSRRKGQRIAERTLFLIAATGGASGILLGMNAFRHKTKHKSFTIGIPLLLILNLLSVTYITKYIQN
ncbi:hypothetical protein BHU72_01615 [Desulfuribacillus stibiiarsenatis]|uniref:DUF1294 domain-containing protein n=1 Tax=Desulfuribacillus stibiiarsenatis TaxID=1390249 RepID=A0A1E5LA18_9FIRM|nr:DUF1294 domain-containing protein [Desulfuribacillus stibiiarsenatis]OEH86980.1 hypothetical protein BHU72_01615 [Desulfuribacillus stibiiarsenatis]